MSISKENYLKAIYQLKREGHSALSSTIAKKLSVSGAAVTDMSKKLTQQGLVSYQKYKGIELTQAGEQIALQVIRRHRLWELFLSKVLDLSWSQVHDEAERLEHQTSELLIDRIDTYLGYPEFDPHGDPIPDKNGTFPVQPVNSKLIDCEPGRCYQLIRVRDRTNELMEYFTQCGFQLQAVFYLEKKVADANSVVLEMQDRKQVISDFMASNLYVVEVEDLTTMDKNESAEVNFIFALGETQQAVSKLGMFFSLSCQ